MRKKHELPFDYIFLLNYEFKPKVLIRSKKVNKQLTYEKNVNIPNDRLWMKNIWSYIDFFCLEWLARNGPKGVL